MIAEIKEVVGRKYLVAELMEVSQSKIKFFLAKIKAQNVFKTYTVKPLEYDIARYKSLAKKYPDENEYYNDLIQRKNIDHLPDEFQRFENKERVKKIKDFIEKDKFPLFPNTIIATCDLVNTLDDIDEEEPDTDIEDYIEKEDVDSPFSFIAKEGHRLFLYIPYRKKSIVVIDGQHRIRGLEDARTDDVDDYELLFAFLIGYGRSLVAHQFYTVNYNQKPVNKSLLYQLMGQFSDDLNRKTFLHGVVRMMNEIRTSPFHDRIKILGITDKKKSAEDRKLMTVSQAFLIDYLLPSIGDKVPRGLFAPIFYSFYIDEEFKLEIAKLILKFFGALKRCFKNEWNDPEISILSKSLSVGAFIKIMQMVYVNLFVSEYKMDPKSLCQISIDELEPVFEGIDINLFDAEGEFAKGSSAGSLGKLRVGIMNQMDFFEGNTIDEKLDNYKSNLQEFKEWFSEFLKVSKEEDLKNQFQF